MFVPIADLYRQAWFTNRMRALSTKRTLNTYNGSIKGNSRISSRRGEETLT